MLKLWIQVTPSETLKRAGMEFTGVAILAEFVSSGVGAVLQAAADRLVAETEYTQSGTLAYEPAFLVKEPGASPEFLIGAITINVGPEPIGVDKSRLVRALTEDVLEADTASPVVVRVQFEPSNDGTALAAKVTHWRYRECLDDRTAFRDKKRKVTIEIKISDASGAILLATAMQVSATTDALATSTPASGERLPWSKMPTLAIPPSPPMGQFGPVNIQVKITEAAGPSWFARLLGSTLSGQKATIQSYVKDRVTEAMDATAAAKSQVELIAAAQAAWTQYAAAHKEAKVAREAFDKEQSTANLQPLIAGLAVLAERQTLAREAYAKAGLPFQPLLSIPLP